MTTIVIKPDLEVDPTKESGLGLHGLTRVKPVMFKKKKKKNITFFL
jgi:hypothetical protein